MIEIKFTFDRLEDGVAIYKLEMPTENQIARREWDEFERVYPGWRTMSVYFPDWLDRQEEK
jgi:hypothetical protein